MNYLIACGDTTVTLYSSLFEKLPDPKTPQKNLFLNRLQFVKTAFSHDGKTSCFCCKETGLHANQENGLGFKIAKDREDQVETHHEVVKQKNGCDAS